MLYSIIPLTEYTAVIDSRFHQHVSQEIADPEYRSKFYTLDGHNGEHDGSDARILCLTCISRSTGDAKLRGVVLVRNDLRADALAIASLGLVFHQEFPLYTIANIAILYTVDGQETACPLREYMQRISDALKKPG
jgi:hypothetical protein